MSDDEEFLFRQEMSGVKPLNAEQRIKLAQPRASELSLQQRRAAAVAEHTDRNPLSPEGITPLDPWYVLEFKRSGVQNGVYRKLKQGRYEAEARLNLHRVTVAKARRELFEFIEQAESYGMRTVMIVHGKGENSGSKQAASVIKGCVNHWLRELPAVQAFHSAKPQHGGTGAVYILLRKGEEAKQANRERFRES